MIERNTAELWDGVWTKPATVEKDIYTVDKEERLIRWKRMEAMVLDRFGSFEGLTAIESGAGRGTNAALMARRGANVTVLDYSDAAMERARRLFEQLELPVEFVRHDALDLPPSIEGKFDLSMSFGLAEHFLDDRRRGILKAHLDVIREGGLTFISVPNAHNPPYRLHKWITERTGRWSVGEEYPFTRKELCDYCEQFCARRSSLIRLNGCRAPSGMSRNTSDRTRNLNRRRRPRPHARGARTAVCHGMSLVRH
jgi:SAM-dependent methyltransferase